jgi:arabinofuranosyltransferase
MLGHVLRSKPDLVSNGDSPTNIVDPHSESGLSESIDSDTGRHDADSSRSSRPWTARVLVILPVAIMLFGGWSHRWVADDAYIDFRVIGNLTSGRGPVYNPGERVEAFTDPLWVGILSVFHFLAFLPIQWWAVLLGLGFACLGVGAAAHASQKLGVILDGPNSLVVPLGMLVFVAVDASWDFATSGLETGLIFGWIGLSWWLLVRRLGSGQPSFVAAAVIGLGPLIRPDMFLISAGLLVGLAAISSEDTSGWRTVTRLASQWTVAFALPIVYELFRMAYFGLLVPNTALVKTAGSSWWSQGLVYLKDMIGPYWLWFPLVVLGLVLARRLGDLCSSGRQRLAILIAAPVIGGLLDSLYVVKVGGDFMHGRMLLPGVFAICIPMSVPVRSTRNLVALSAGTGWAVVAIASLHYPTYQSIVNGIANERTWYIAHTQNPHPVTPDEFTHSDFGKVGVALRSAIGGSENAPLTRVLLRPTQGDTSSSTVVRATLPEGVVAPVFNVGISGFEAGPDVYIFDLLSLSNPIGAHVSDTDRIRPGHSQLVNPVWMVARFVPSTAWSSIESSLPPDLAEYYDQHDVEAARGALSCGTLHEYLQAITRPLSPGRAISNMIHSFSFTTLRFSPDPVVAERQLCGTGG